jgi:hypothetical protein
MTQEALKQALEALENHTAIKHPQQIHYRDKAITAIKEALAQPEQFCDTNCVWTDHHPDCRLTQTQEPVAWLITDEKINSLQVDSIQRLIDRARHAHMTDIKLRINGQDEWHQADWLKHLTRTTPPQSEQEPVAWMFQHDETGRMNYVSNDGVHNPTMFLEMNPRYALVCPLYTHPPQRTWVGLTDEEFNELDKEDLSLRQFVQAIDDKLKEKNGFAEENT